MAKKRKNKVYFWLKLDQNFFKNLAIKQALRMPGGKDMIIVYQMLMLKSLVTDGYPKRKIAEPSKWEFCHRVE